MATNTRTVSNGEVEIQASHDRPAVLLTSAQNVYMARGRVNRVPSEILQGGPLRPNAPATITHTVILTTDNGVAAEVQVTQKPAPRPKPAPKSPSFRERVEQVIAPVLGFDSAEQM